MFSIFWTNGQICSATSRLLLQENIAPRCSPRWWFRPFSDVECAAAATPLFLPLRFLKLLKEGAEGIKIGNPLTPDVKMGPVVSKPQYDTVRRPTLTHPISHLRAVCSRLEILHMCVNR